MGEYHLCNNGDCKCLTIWKRSWNAPLCTITHGDWGDDYPDARIIKSECSLDGKFVVEPFTNKVVYGNISQEEASKESTFVIKALNNHNQLLKFLAGYIELATEYTADMGPCDHPAGVCICGVKQDLEEAKELFTKLIC